MARNSSTMAARANSISKSDDGVWETIKVIIQALLIAFFVRTFLFQPFNIPSGSMYPTLKEGDYLFVSKLSYGYGKYSFNFALGAFGYTVFKCCPVDFPGRKILADVPDRGDVAVFKLPSNPEVDYIKRVIGLPGDRIQMIDGVLQINGSAVKKERLGDFVDSQKDVEGDNLPDHAMNYPRYLETLPNNVTYEVLDISNSSADNTEEFIVPAGHYFMMGDNRDNSQDSRYQNAVGFVPLENFMGRADIIFFSIKPNASIWRPWEIPFGIRWGRFFNLL
jgi:signal peptidase I